MSYTDEEAKAAWKVAASGLRAADRKTRRRLKLAGYFITAIVILAGTAAILKA